MHSEPESPDHGAAPAPDAAAPPPCGVVRRPVGAKSRRPPTQMLTRETSTEANASSPHSAAIREVDEEAQQQQQQQQQQQLDLDNVELDFSVVEIGDCEPVAEAQDPEEAARPAARQLPRGAVPLMPLAFGAGAGGGGGGVFVRPRQLKPSQPPRPQDTIDSPADSAPISSSPSPKPRRPPPPNAAALAAAAMAAKLNSPASHGDSLELPDGGEPRAASPSLGLAASEGDDRLQSSPSGHSPLAKHSPSAGHSPPGVKGEAAPHAEAPTPPPKLRRPPGASPAAGASPISVLGVPDLLAMRQHLRRTAAPVFTSPPSEKPPPPVPQLRRVQASPQQNQEQQPAPFLPPPQLPPKPLKRRPMKDDSGGDKATATLD